MKKIALYTFLICCSWSSFAQTDSADVGQGDTSLLLQDTAILLNRYGGLRHDDPQFNPQTPAWHVSARVLSSNVFNWALNRYFFKTDWTSSGVADWKRNFYEGPEWDVDGFGVNFIGHPHTGSYYFNSARAHGYNYWQSFPFTIQGSVTWEWFGENERPSYNDLINTTLSGAFLGEVFYRITSKLLDDTKKGRSRVAREAISAMINPTRAFNRLTSRKMFRITKKEVYQKEPVNVEFSGGFHKLNAGRDKHNRFATGESNAMLQLQVDYGDPFESRTRKPFDVFRFRVELSEGDNRHLLDNVIGYGLLKGKTVSGKKLKGFFQHYDYWRYNEVFELGSMGFGAGMITRSTPGKKFSVRTNTHLALVPLAGNNNPFLPDSIETRTYNFGGGIQSKLEGIVDISNRLEIGLRAYHYFITTYVGRAGNGLVGIIKPFITVRVFKNLHAGIEHHIYHNDRYRPNEKRFRFTRTEQKFFLQWKLNEY